MQTAILLGLVYAFAWSMDNIAGSSFMDRPIVCGALTGLVMGNFEQGLVIGGTLELVWMGFISYAGIINGETRIGACLLYTSSFPLNRKIIFFADIIVFGPIVI